MGYQDTLTAFRRGDNALAKQLAEADLQDAIESSNVGAQVDAVCMLARVALRDGDLSEVTARASEGRRLARVAGDRRLERMPIHLLAVAARLEGRSDESRTLYRESIALNESLDESRMAALEHRNLAYVELHAGDVEAAKELIAESRQRLVGVDDPMLGPYLTFDDAVLAAVDGDNEEAVRLLVEADAQFRTLAIVPDPDDAAEMAALRQAMGVDAHE